MHTSSEQRIVDILRSRPADNGVTLREIREALPGENHDDVVTSLQERGVIEYIEGMAQAVAPGQPSHTITDDDYAYFRGPNFV